MWRTSWGIPTGTGLLEVLIEFIENVGEAARIVLPLYQVSDTMMYAKGEKLYVGENGKDFAKRLLDKKYGLGNYKTGPGTEFNKIRKWGDRGFK